MVDQGSRFLLDMRSHAPLYSPRQRAVLCDAFSVSKIRVLQPFVLHGLSGSTKLSSWGSKWDRVESGLDGESIWLTIVRLSLARDRQASFLP
jgi:hypothetical protein